MGQFREYLIEGNIRFTGNQTKIPMKKFLTEVAKYLSSDTVEVTWSGNYGARFNTGGAIYINNNKVILDFDDSGIMYEITKIAKKYKYIKSIKDTEGVNYDE